MIKVYRSQTKNLLYNLDKQCKYTFNIEANNRKAWNGLISILNYVKSKRQYQYKKILKEHKAFISLLYGNLIFDELSENEKLNQIIARTTSHLTHNWYIQQPIFVEGSIVLSKAFLDDDLFLIQDFFELDNETIAIILILIKKKKHPNLIMGYLFHNGNNFFDKNGVLWQKDTFQREQIILSFFYCKDFQLIDLIDNSHKLNQRNNNRTTSEYIKPTNIISSDTFLSKFNDIKRAFYSFGFTQVLHDGISLIDSLENFYSIPRDITYVLGELYALVALSAHNRQFTSKGHQLLAEFIEKNLKQALKCELKPELRAATLYRLAVLYGRRKKNFQKSITVSNQMINFVNEQNVSSQERFYQLGWAYNIRAYNYQFLKNTEQAKKDINKSQEYFEQLKQFISNSDNLVKKIWMRDTYKSNTLPLYNKLRTLTDRVELHNQTNKVFQYLDENDIEDLNKIENRLGYYKSNHNLVKATNWAKIGIDNSIQHHRAFKEQFFRAELANLYYKYGDLSSSIEQINFIKKNYIKFRHPFTMTDISLSTVMIKIRGRKFDDVFKILNQHITDSENTNVLAELHATRYLAGVLSGRELDFRKDKGFSIDLASKIGNASVTLRVISLIVHALKENQNVDELRDAYNNGVEIIDYGMKNGLALPPEHVLNILVGHQEFFGLDKNRMRFIDENLETMLYVSESWWTISRILNLINNQYNLSKKTMDIITQRNKIYKKEQ